MVEPKVGVVVGSDSDLPVMQDAIKVLKQLGVTCEISIASAHRSPGQVTCYAETAITRGIEVIIAGAGGAAHLAGVLAAITSLPVIGVPVQTTALGGLDSLLSMVQMPRGVPVATMSINGAQNAGIFAVQILGIKYPTIRANLEQFRREQTKKVEEKAAKLTELGLANYLAVYQKS